jgi:hypothetical protein
LTPYSPFVGSIRRYWQWLGGDLRLTLAGRWAFTIVLVLGVGGVIGNAAGGGEHGDQAGGALFVFVALALGVVVGLDAAARGVRTGLRRVKGRR